MVESQIIKELANGKVGMFTSLTRTKVLLQDIGDKLILDWIDNELEGYSDNAKLPEYRRIKGAMKCSFRLGRLKYSNIAVSIDRLPESIKDAFRVVEMRQSIEAIKEMTDPNGISFQIPADYFGVIAKANNPNMDIYEAEIQVSKIDIQGILSKVTNRLLDILIQLEKEFGCLDELDICVKSKSEDELREIKNNIEASSVCVKHICLPHGI